MHCATCDTRNDRDARFCRVCGTVLAAATASSRPRYTIGAADGDACAVCGKQNPTGARFCVYCAAPVGTATTGRTVALHPAAAGTARAVYTPPAALAISNGTNLLVRAVWFVVVGWWLGLVWAIVAWLFNISLIGLPVGVLMLNTIPQIMTLRPRRATRQPRQPEQPFVLRALWFGVIGWWASLVWMVIAWSFSASIVLLPIGFWMFDRVPTITTLAAE